MGRPERNPKRSVLTILIVAVSVSAIAWLLLNTKGFVSSTSNSQLKIALSKPEAAASPGSGFQIQGCTTMPGKVQLQLNSVPYDETTTAADNTFKFENVALPSTVTIGALSTAVNGRSAYKADTSMNWASLKKANPSTTPTPSPTPTPNPTPIPPCQLPTLQPAPSATPAPEQQIISRKISCVLGYRTIDLKISVELPKDDPRAASLRVRPSELTDFIRRVFLDFKINGSPIDYRFQQMNPEIVTSESTIVVSADSNSKYKDFVPTLKDELNISTAWRPENSKDAITLQISDYRVRFLDPAPSTTTNTSLTWNGNKDVSQIKVGLDYDAVGSPSKFLKIFRLSPYQVFPFEAIPIVANLLGLLVAVPIVWLLKVVRQKEALGLGEKLVSKLETSSQLFLAVIFGGPAIYSMYNLTAPVNALLERIWHRRFYYDDDFRVLLIIGLLMWLIFMLLQQAFRFVRETKIGFWLWTVFGAIRNGWTLALLVLIIIGFTFVFVPADWFETPRYLAAFINLAIFLVLSVIVISFYRTGEGDFGSWLSRWKIAAVLLGLVALGLVLMDPRPAEGFMFLFDKKYTPTLKYVRTFLFLLRDLMPYALFLGITILLWRRQQSNTSGNELRFRIGSVLFAGYIVGSTPNVFLLPLPFFIALWVFPRYVMEKSSRWDEIDSIRDDLYSNRKEKLKKVIRPESKRLEEGLEQLERNFLSGEVTDDEYKKLKKQIEQDLEKIRSESTLLANLQVQEVVIGIGVEKTNWKNGKWAALRGTLLALPFASLYLWELLQRSTWPPQPYFLLGLIIPLVTFVAYWTVCAFFFGYFFPYIRGNSGLRKGLTVATLIIVCLLLVWILSLSNAYALFLRAGQTFLFFTLLGTWSDYLSFRKAMGTEFNWKQFAQFEYIPSLAAFGSMVLASFSAAVNSVMQDQYQSVVKQLVGMVIQQVPRFPP